MYLIRQIMNEMIDLEEGVHIWFGFHQKVYVLKKKVSKLMIHIYNHVKMCEFTWWCRCNST